MLLIFPVFLSLNLLATCLGFTLPIGVVKPAEDPGSERELTDAFVTAFDAADSDGDNQLSATEFPRAVAVTFNVSSSELVELPRMGHVFQEIDANHDGLISREEEKEFILNKEESLDKLVFALFDQNEDGRLNVTEVTALFGDLFQGEETSDLVGQLIREFDENADGELELEELFGEGANGTRTGNGEQTSTTTLAPQTSTSTMNIYEAISHAHATLNQSRNATEWKSRILSLLFHKADSNSDGKITPDEFERFVALAYLSSGGRPNGDESAKQQLAIAKVAFQLADLNGDGHLTKEEFLTGSDGDFSEEKAKKIAQRLMDVADRDKDGLLTIAELEASFAEIIGHPLSHKMRKSVVTSFFEADSNLDGLLTMEEILAELAKYAE